jgi:hypothetical protein
MAFTPITDGTDIQAVSLLNQLIDAFNERLTVTTYRPSPTGDWANNAPMSSVSAGEDLQDKAFWNLFHSRIEDQISKPTYRIVASSDSDYTGAHSMRWLVPGDVSLGVADPSGYHGWTRFTTLTAFRGWRRATTWDPSVDTWSDPDDDMWNTDERPENGYGAVASGDIIGPWLIKDIQVALSEMYVRYFLPIGGSRFGRLESKIGYSDSSYAAAVTSFNASSVATSASIGMEAAHFKSVAANHTVARARCLFGLYQTNDKDETDKTDADRTAIAATYGATAYYLLLTDTHPSTSPVNPEYYANGDSVSEGVYSQVTSASVDSSSYGGSLSPEPVEKASDSTSKGYASSSNPCIAVDISAGLSYS